MKGHAGRAVRLLAAVVIGCASLSATFARAADDTPPDPELERRTFKVAEGFEMTLFAADPLVAKPIAMNFDEKGRLFSFSTQSTQQGQSPIVAPAGKDILTSKDLQECVAKAQKQVKQ